MWRQTVTCALRDKFPGAEVRETGNGEQAVLLAQQLPDLVVAGLHVPPFEVFHLLREMRVYEDVKRVPLLVMSDDPAPAVIAELARQGIDDFVVKPFRIERLLARVERIIERMLGGRVGALPRNAVRRKINEKVYVQRPVLLLTPHALYVSALRAHSPGQLLDCDISGVCRLLHLPEQEISLFTVGEETREISGFETVRLAPVERSAELFDGVTRFFPEGDGQQPVQFLGEQTPTLGIPARVVDLSCLGIGVVSPLEFEVGKRVELSMRRLLRPLFSQARNSTVLARIVRVEKAERGYLMGMRFTKADPDLVRDIMFWASAE